ncbi:MAG: hypothetical protein M3O70_22535 [Actinomycetota bacterium]|nr:hypothetical protein [Actinomycetota bacterium]
MSDGRRWLDEPRNVRRVVLAVYVVCGLLLLADPLYSKTPHFSFEGWFGFYPVFGFVVSFTLVLTAKQLRRLLRRDEDFYERREQAPDDQ